MHNFVNRKRMFSRRGIKGIQILICRVVQSSRIGTSGPYIDAHQQSIINVTLLSLYSTISVLCIRIVHYYIILSFIALRVYTFIMGL